MAKHNSARGGRSRKRRSTRQAALQSAPVEAELAQPGTTATEQGRERGSSSTARGRRQRTPPRAASERRGGGFKDPQSLGERPQAPWHPLPLSELLILVGAIGTIVGLSRGVSHGGPTLLAGLAAVVIGTVEVTLREHRSGYRSHTIMLALLPTLVFHSVVVLTVAALTQVPRLLNVGLLAIDGVLFVFLYKLLRAGFLDARRERTFAGRR